MEQINFAIEEAVRQLRQSLGQIQIADSFDITLTSENTDVPQSSAAPYLQLKLNKLICLQLLLLSI